MGEWQDIASAPKDGTEILLFFPTYSTGRVGAYVYRDFDAPVWDGIDGYQYLDSEDGPTHWQSLPEPPK